MSERVALVTGGSRGIGRAICRALATRGDAVAVNHRSGVEQAKETLALIESMGGEGMVVEADVTRSAAVDGMFAEVEDALGPVTIVVNNAGIRRDGLAMRMSDADWQEVISTNLFGAFACSRRALRTMLRAGFGRIVNVASVAGLQGSPGQANYCAAKAGLIGLTKSLAREVARKNITVNSVAPGLVATELTTSLPEARWAELVHAIPAGRAGTPEEIGDLVAFLCSEQAAYITGGVFVADGGMTA
ncbi:MAG: 3-oxoacyl-[acyl-carrier-protein] reductase [Actinomycetota bacterium]